MAAVLRTATCVSSVPTNGWKNLHLAQIVHTGNYPNSDLFEMLINAGKARRGEKKKKAA